MRDPYFDNAKAILIFLVVFAHLIEKTMLHSHWVLGLYYLIYLFHMPAFILITGYFANRSTSAKESVIKLVKYYIIFSILYLPLSRYNIELFLTRPYWVLWFLASTICWYLLVPFFTKFKHPVAFSVLVSILAGYVPMIDYTFSISRTLFFLPFFLIGANIKASTLNRIRTKPIQIISIVLIPILFLIAMILSSRIDVRWLYGSLGYSALGSTAWFSGIYRILYYVTSSLMVVLFLSLAPSKFTVFTKIGENTLHIFTLHAPFIILISFTLNESPIPLVFKFFGVILISMFLVILLSRYSVRDLITLLKMKHQNIIKD